MSEYFSTNIHHLFVHMLVYNKDLLINMHGKAVPLQARCGPEGSRKLSFPDFMTTAQDGGKVNMHGMNIKICLNVP